MVLTPQVRLRAGTSLAIGAAGATLIAALLLSRQTKCLDAPASGVVTPASDGVLTVRLASRKILLGDVEQDIAVTIRAPQARTHGRPPLSLAVVIDRSGSMSGKPMQNAKRAAQELVDELQPDDAITILTYSSGDETVTPIGRATEEHKQAARDAIANIYADGGTCISCGLGRGASELARSPIRGGLRRIVLISDGQANEGIWDRNELAQLAATTAQHGVSISSVGVGLDFDEVTMMRLAEQGHGNYYFVENAANLGAMFAKELGGLADTVATDVSLEVQPFDGTSLERACGYPVDYSVDQSGGITIPIADLRAGETRKVVIHTRVPADHTGEYSIAQFALSWRNPIDGTIKWASTELTAQVVSDRAEVVASLDRDALAAIEEAKAGQVLEEATSIYETQGAQAAQRVIERHMATVRAKNLEPAAAQRIEKAASEATGAFAAEPNNGTKAKKVTRGYAYDLAR